MASDSWAKQRDTRTRLEKCWSVDINWKLYPDSLKKGCQQVGKSLNVSPTSVLGSYMILCGYVLSPARVQVPNTSWKEPVLLWLTICMPTGSGKSTLFGHMCDLLEQTRELAGVKDTDPIWRMDNATFEKMGALMMENSCRMLGIYDELAAFLSQINLYRGRSLSDSHELATFLQLYNGHPWRRDTVTGEANFSMTNTNLTIGGFTQAGTVRNLIDTPANSEKGLSHRFLWLFPAPLFGKLNSLENIDDQFTKKICALLGKQWRKCLPRSELPPRMFAIDLNPKATTTDDSSTATDDVEATSPSSVSADANIPRSKDGESDEEQSESDSESEGSGDEGDGNEESGDEADDVSRSGGFAQYYDKIQQYLQAVSGMDEFLAGMLSKNRGQVLRVAAILHILFGLDDVEGTTQEDCISQAAIIAAIDFVEVAAQQTAYIGGRGNIKKDMKKCKSAIIKGDASQLTAEEKLAAYCLLLPGDTLYLTPLLNAKKFRGRGNKDAAVSSFALLAKRGFGENYCIGTKQYEFLKCPIPQKSEERVAFAKKLSELNISLAQYQTAYNKEAIKPITSPLSRKRVLDSFPDPPADARADQASTPKSSKSKKSKKSQQ